MMKLRAIRFFQLTALLLVSIAPVFFVTASPIENGSFVETAITFQEYGCSKNCGEGAKQSEGWRPSSDCTICWWVHCSSKRQSCNESWHSADNDHCNFSIDCYEIEQ